MVVAVADVLPPVQDWRVAAGVTVGLQGGHGRDGGGRGGLLEDLLQVSVGVVLAPLTKRPVPVFLSLQHHVARVDGRVLLQRLQQNVGEVGWWVLLLL